MPMFVMVTYTLPPFQTLLHWPKALLLILFTIFTIFKKLKKTDKSPWQRYQLTWLPFKPPLLRLTLPVLQNVMTQLHYKSAFHRSFEMNVRSSTLCRVGWCVETELRYVQDHWHREPWLTTALHFDARCRLWLKTLVLKRESKLVV